MRTIFAVLFIFQAINASVLKQVNSTDLDYGLYAEEESEDLIRLGAEGGSGGEEEVGGVESKALDKVIEALGQIILPTVMKATKLTKRKEQEFAKGLVKKLKDGEPYVKRAFGKAILEEHLKCDRIKDSFYSTAKVKGVFRDLKKALIDDDDDDDDDDLSEEEVIGKVIEEHGKEDSDILGQIVDASKLDFGAHPAIKAVAVIKKLLSHSVCENPVEGFLKEAAEEIFAIEGANPFANLQNKVLPFLKGQKCRKGLVDKKDESSNLKKLFEFIFKTDSPCCDAKSVKRNVDLVLQGEKVKKKVFILAHVYNKRQNATVQKVISLLTSGQEYYAYQSLGDESLRFLRELSLIGITVHKRMEKQKHLKPIPFPGKCDAPSATHAHQLSARITK